MTIATGAAPDEPARLYHIALPEDWAAARAADHYTMSSRGLTFDQVGFVHLSFGHQVEATANLWYGDLPEVVLLEIDPGRCGDRLVVERGSGAGTEDFPHLYAPLSIGAVMAARHWKRGPDGAYALADVPRS